MRGISKLVVLAAAVAMAAGCSESAKPVTSSGVQHGVAGKYYYVNLFSPPIGGIVSSLPAGVSCGASSLGTPVPDTNGVLQYAPAYYTGADKCGQIKFDWSADPVVLSAAPQGTGNFFLGWAGDCSGTGTCTLHPGADKTVIAIFGAAGTSHGNLLTPADHAQAFRDSIAGTSALKCSKCHGADYNGQGIAPSCTACHAAAGKPNWLSDCTFCHAAPPSSRSHQFVAAGDLTACNACHGTTVNATGGIIAGGTHMNGVVDESFTAGGRNCATCHGALMGDATTYHHVMGTLKDGWTTYPANPQPTDAADKGCIQCHVDHDLFTGTRGSNLRASILNTTGTNTDGGLCTSCHGLSQTKLAGGQKPDGTLGTAAIDATGFWASGHSFPVGGSITGTDFDFQVTCTKCHNSDTATQFQDSTYRFGLHTSADRRLRALLGRAPGTDDKAEEFCYRCHSNTSDAVGGTRKSASLMDWYGAASMPNGSTGIYAQMVGGRPSATTTTASLLYLKPQVEETPATGPAAGSPEVTSAPTSTLYLTSQDAAGAPAAYLDTTSGLTWNNTALVQKTMALTADTAQSTVNGSTVSGTTAYDRVAQFLSPPLAKAASWASGNIVIYINRAETNANNNCYLRYSVYKWSGGVASQMVAPANASGGSEFPTTAATSNTNMAISVPQNLAAGDQILVEVAIYKNAPSATSSNGCTLKWGLTATDQSRVTFPVTSDGTFPEFQTAAPLPLDTTWVARSMSPFAPKGAAETITGTGTANAFQSMLWKRASFTSPKVAVATTLPASPWTLAIWDNRNSANPSYLRYRIFRWNAAGTQGPDIVSWRTFGTAMGNVTAAQLISVPAAAVVATDLAVGDQIVVEVEAETMNMTASAASNSTIAFGAGAASNVTLPVAVTFASPTTGTTIVSGHQGALYTGVHRPNPAEENLAYLATAKHAECSDCHDAHGAKRGNQADGGTATAASATTLADSNQAWPPNAWIGYTVDIVSGTGAGGRAMITGNDATTLTFGTLATAPAIGSGYRVSMRSNGGAVVSATANTLVDSQSAVGGAKSWATDAFAGWTVRIVLGAGMGQSKQVASNSANSLTLASSWDVTPDGTSRYVLDKLPGVLTGAGGVNVTAWDSGTPSAWSESKTISPAAGSTTTIPAATTQWQVCFKCHSAANAGLTTWKSTWSDLSAEFNPRNQSYHPIVAPSAAASGTSGYGNSQIAAATLTNGWKPGDMMYCSDCHGNDSTGYSASQGPHASAVKFVLRGPNTNWPFMADGATRWTASSATPRSFLIGQGTADGLFCLNCHDITASGGSVHTRGDHNNAACTGCHLLIPHGGKVKRLIRTSNTPAPYIDVAGTAVSNQTSDYPTGKALLKAYAGGTSDNNTSCGANCTTHHNLPVNSATAPVNAW